MKVLIRSISALALLAALLFSANGIVLAAATTVDNPPAATTDTTAQAQPTDSGATPNPNALNPSDSISNICKNASPDNLPPSCKPEAQVTDTTPNPLFGPDGILTKAINLLSLVVGVISVFVIIIAGVKLITSSGDPNSVTESRNAILYAVIALAITASAQIAVRFILSKLHF